MLIKYRSGVVRSSRNARCMSKIGMGVSRPLVHMRSSFTFKSKKFTWPPTIYFNRSTQTMDISGKYDVSTSTDYDPRFQSTTLEQMDIRRAKLFLILLFQSGFFFILFIVGNFCASLFVEHYRREYASYSFTHTGLVELQTSLIDNCSNLTDLPCSLQMHINVYFLSVKFVLLYYLSIVIGMTYTWHRTVRFSHCVYAFFIIAVIIFRTGLVFYFDRIVEITFITCVSLVQMFSALQALMPYNAHDPLRELCQRITEPNNPNGFLLDGHSKRARFYRWAKNIKKKWNIEEEKLIVTAIAGIISFIIVILFAYFWPLSTI